LIRARRGIRIDILIAGDDLARVNEAIRERGFTIHSGRIPFRLGQSTEQVVYRVLKVSDRKTLTLDLLIVPPFLEGVWRSRTSIQWQGRNVQIVSRGGLARMKRIAGRKQDLADLDALGLSIDEEEPERGP
jgi:hypothetical protein